MPPYPGQPTMVMVDRRRQLEARNRLAVATAHALHTPDSAAPSVTPPYKARGVLGRPDRSEIDEFCIKIDECCSKSDESLIRRRLAPDREDLVRDWRYMLRNERHERWIRGSSLRLPEGVSRAVAGLRSTCTGESEPDGYVLPDGILDRRSSAPAESRGPETAGQVVVIQLDRVSTRGKQRREWRDGLTNTGVKVPEDCRSGRGSSRRSCRGSRR